jgi:hypothetical protein
VVELTVVPNEGYQFNNWSGSATGTANPLSITMNGNKSVTANLTVAPAVLISPSGTLNSWNNTYSWTGVSGATWYVFDVLRADNSTLVHQWVSAAQAGCNTDLSCVYSPAATANLTNGTYRWRVQDYGPSGYGNATPLKNFTLEQ